MIRIFFLMLTGFALPFKIYAQPGYYGLFPESSNQVLFVKTPHASSITGTMVLYERKNKNRPWKQVDAFPVTVGSSGLAWDETTIPPRNISLPAKHEGDGKSPAGIFKLGPVFSYHPLKKLRMPFKQVDSNDICVDDVSSVYYNRLTDADTVARKDWNSFEYMHRKDEQYEYGIWVRYNSDKTFAGRGSCIFLHVWVNMHTPTAGCTAMSKEKMIKTIRWIDERKKPVLVQVTDRK